MCTRKTPRYPRNVPAAQRARRCSASSEHRPQLLEPTDLPGGLRHTMRKGNREGVRLSQAGRGCRRPKTSSASPAGNRSQVRSKAPRRLSTGVRHIRPGGERHRELRDTLVVTKPSEGSRGGGRECGLGRGGWQGRVRFPAGGGGKGDGVAGGAGGAVGAVDHGAAVGGPRLLDVRLRAWRAARWTTRSA